MFGVGRSGICAFRNINGLRRAHGAGILLPPEREAEINACLPGHTNESASELTNLFGGSERPIRRMRQRIRMQRSSAYASAETVDDAMDGEPMVEWILENMLLDQIENVSANLDRIRNALAGMAMSSAHDRRDDARRDDPVQTNFKRRF